jgi:hypothetical protein
MATIPGRVRNIALSFGFCSFRSATDYRDVARVEQQPSAAFGALCSKQDANCPPAYQFGIVEGSPVESNIDVNVIVVVVNSVDNPWPFQNHFTCAALCATLLSALRGTMSIVVLVDEESRFIKVTSRIELGCRVVTAGDLASAVG